MAYSQEYFKNFEAIFNKIAQRHGYYSVFDDFLDLFINAWCLNYNLDLKRIRSLYNKEERLNFGLLIKETIFILNQNISSDTDWFDVFGTFYESASISKHKGFAQYFTPPTICDFMAQIVAPESREKIADPACGSARMSLAANRTFLGAFHFLVDLDYTCAKMAALNLMLHGINGVVISDDGLFPGNSFKGAFIVNRKIRYTGVPEIEFEPDIVKAYNYVRKETACFTKSNHQIKIVDSEQNNFEDVTEFLNKNNNQYSMF